MSSLLAALHLITLLVEYWLDVSEEKFDTTRRALIWSEILRNLVPKNSCLVDARKTEVFGSFGHPRVQVKDDHVFLVDLDVVKLLACPDLCAHHSNIGVAVAGVLHFCLTIDWADGGPARADCSVDA